MRLRNGKDLHQTRFLQSPCISILIGAAIGFFLRGFLDCNGHNSVNSPKQTSTVVHAADVPLRPTSHEGISKKQLLENNVIPTISGCAVAQIEPHNSVGNHVHPTMHEIFWILQGEGTATTNGIVLTLKQDSLLHVVPGSNHRLDVKKGSSIPLRFLYCGITVD